ncbi:hypothetical protein JK207_00540 [Gluconobacter cerinus]|uniref:hypothetical protein n=1 Tax=Gluconobacter cerinus TaxID=38307 RepID=UPI001B8B65F9|nr:hypothetical protein [Gluconobacter cerinus]MBS1020523.1 hypothetical protein [Gluconobacter cerinus]
MNVKYGLDPGQVKNFTVIPTLTAMGSQFASLSAINLMLGIAMAESQLRYKRQLTNSGYGPARGLPQMELATHDDCWTNWLNSPSQAPVARVIRGLIGNLTPHADLMINNDAYAFAMARIKCWRDRGPLPAWNDAAGMSAFHKRVYNTGAGAADPEANLQHFKAAIAA